jgi:hypothetical protein
MLDPRFSMAWQGQNPGGDTSASGLDMVVAVSAAKSGWSPQEIADLLICRRKARGDEFKLDRLDYFQLTIQRALDAAGEGVVVKAASPAYERGPEPPSAVALPASHALQTAPTNEAELFAWMNGLPESIHSFRLSFTDAIPPVGFVHEYFGVVEASGSDAYPGFTLSSALVDLSMAVGRKRYIEYFGKLFGNIYAMLVGHPHVSRKNQTAETARGIVRQALGRDWLVSGDTTPQALVARLAEHGIRVWVNTEVGKMLDAIKRGTYNAGLDTVLRDLYTCGECGLDRKQERDSVLAEHTFLSVLVAAPTRSLERFTTDEMVEDGLISRFLVAVSPADANTRDSLPKGSLDTTSLVESLRSIDRTISNPHGEMVQIVVREEEEQSMSLKGVERAVEAWLDGLQKWIPVDQENIDTMGAFRGRLLTATLKIALLLSLAKDPRCTEIDPASLYYAMVATVCYARDMLKLLRRLLQDWEQRLEERILARIGATIDKAIDEATGDQTKLQGLLDRPGHIHIKRRALQQNLRLPSGLPYGMTPSKALDTALRGLSEAGMVQWMKADIYVPFGTLTEAQQRAILVVSDLLSNKNAGRDGTGSGATPPSGTEPQQGGGDG